MLVALKNWLPQHPRWLAVSIVVLLPLPSSAQDTLIIKSTNTDQLAKRRGTIVAWQGSTVTIESGGRERNVDAARIVEVQTNWPAGMEQGKQLLAEGRFQEAYQQFEKARQIESRPWVQHEIMAGMIQCLQATENVPLAIRLFSGMIADDPQSRFFYLIPLQWVPPRGSKPAVEEVDRWMESDNPVFKLMGASWAMAGASRAAAIQTLNELTQDTSPRVAHLAAAQLWKSRTLSAREKEIARWQRQILAMPNDLRGGPWLVLAEAQSRNNLHDDAAINFMRIPILYSTHRSLVAPALYQAGIVLQNAGRIEDARSVWDELKRDYPNSFWAGQAAGKLNQ